MPKRLGSGSSRQPKVTIRRYGGVYAARAIFRVAIVFTAAVSLVLGSVVATWFGVGANEAWHVAERRAEAVE